MTTRRQRRRKRSPGGIQPGETREKRGEGKDFCGTLGIEDCDDGIYHRPVLPSIRSILSLEGTGIKQVPLRSVRECEDEAYCGMRSHYSFLSRVYDLPAIELWNWRKHFVLVQSRSSGSTNKKTPPSFANARRLEKFSSYKTFVSGACLIGSRIFAPTMPRKLPLIQLFVFLFKTQKHTSRDRKSLRRKIYFRHYVQLGSPFRYIPATLQESDLWLTLLTWNFTWRRYNAATFKKKKTRLK